MTDTIVTVLQKIQTEIKAPKSQQGRFGKSRSAEDIIAQAKPILAKHGAAITLADEIVQVGERNYIKATACLRWNESVLEVHGWAWEGELNRGLDASQVTGMASSYARKYAMGGLFALDDTKDADGHMDAPVSNLAKAKDADGHMDAPVSNLAKAKDALNKEFEQYGHATDDAKKKIIDTVIGKAKIDTEAEVDAVMQALEDGLV